MIKINNTTRNMFLSAFYQKYQIYPDTEIDFSKN